MDAAEAVPESTVTPRRTAAAAAARARLLRPNRPALRDMGPPDAPHHTRGHSPGRADAMCRPRAPKGPFVPTAVAVRARFPGTCMVWNTRPEGERPVLRRLRTSGL